jgi:hypothetical protein
MTRPFHLPFLFGRIVGSVALAAVFACGSSSGSNASGDGSAGGSEDGGGQDGTMAGSGSGSGGSSSGSSSGASSGSSSGVGADGGSGSSGGGDGGTATGGVLMLHNHVNRDGLFVDGKLTKTALMSGMMHVDTTFDGTVVGNVHASPLYVASGVGGKGTFYVATDSNNVYALDETTGKSAIQTKSAGTAAQNTYTGGCGNVHPIGITGTPAIDATTRLMVFDAATADAQNTILTHTIHAWSIDTFTESWSLDVSTLTDAVVGKFMPKPENQRSAVLIVGGIAYVAYGGHSGDCGAYHGWVVGVPLSGISGAKAYATPAAESGMWGCGGPASDGTSVFVATGNGSTLQGGAWGGAFSVIKLQPGPVFGGGTANYWLAVNDNGDADLGGSMPLVVDAPAITPSALVVQVGKDGNAYLVNRTNLGGAMSPVATAHVMNGEISNAAAWATVQGVTYVAMTSNGSGNGASCPGTAGDLVVVKLDPAAANKITTVWCADNKGGGSPSITTSDGTNDALVWTMGTEKHNATQGSNQLHAWDLATGQAIVTASDTVMNTRHFTTPIAVNGRVLVAGDNRLYALKP